MKQRLFFLLILLFWVVMNTLLWQAEFSSRSRPGSPVALDTVWQRLLTAPDSSSLEVFHRGRKLGICRWVASVSEAPVTTGDAGEGAPDGMVKKVTGYSLDFDGNLALKDLGGNLRFYFRLNLATNQVWRDLQLRISLKPAVWEFYATAELEQVVFRLNDGEADSEVAYSFAELADPKRVLRDFEVPYPVELLMNSVMPAAGGSTNLARLSLGLQWEARHDTLTLGNATMRVYRLQARLLDRYQVVVFVSRAGELLRVELPGNVVLVNYALGNL